MGEEEDKQQEIIPGTIIGYKAYPFKLFKTIKEVSNVLSQDITIDIIFYLSDEPKRYKDLKKLLKTSDATLSRRLDKLFDWSIRDCLGWKLTSKPFGGAIATIGSTGLTWLGIEYGGGGEQLDK